MKDFVLMYSGGGIFPPAIEGDAGYDVASKEYVILPPRSQDGWQCVQLGSEDGDLKVLAPEGYWYEFKARSGMVRGKGNNLLVAPTVIDRYTGPLFCFCCNLGDEPMVLNPGDRIAQLVLHRTYTPELIVVDELPKTARGDRGFNSTGRSQVININGVPR